MLKKIYKAHINEKTRKVQTVKEHSVNTARLAAKYAVMPLKEMVSAMGMLHDSGKVSNAFQRRINGENIRVDHSTCGASIAIEKYPFPAGLMMAYCIAGHHGGIPDAGHENDYSNNGGLYNRINLRKENKDPELDFSDYKNEITLPKVDMDKLNSFLFSDCMSDAERRVDKFSFITRYCFSCLTDADSIDAAIASGTMQEQKLKVDFKRCLEKVNKELQAFKCETDLQKARGELQKQVFDKISLKSEIYLMNMPTGSGKTLCSIKFALEKAIEENKKRIIYVIPYNSIIDQTISEFERIFGEDAQILRHQSSFSYEDEEDIDEDYRIAAKKATENWDCPLIVTTAVQFFESMYSNKKRKLRKIHNIADSILIFDEAHLMPRKYLKPCLQSISYVTKYLNSEAILLTATMPDFHKLISKYALPESRIEDLVSITEDFKPFKKSSFAYMGKVDDETLIEKACKNPSSLIIVNKKETAQRLYEMCNGRKYHLSTYMVPVKRKEVIDEIKREIKQLEEDYPDLSDVPEERRIIVVSTSLIEAGVDLDFHTVYRELAGLDSVLQSGGRNNREGKRTNATTFIFEFSDTKPTDEGNLTRSLLEKGADVSEADVITGYYERLFNMKDDEISAKTMSKYCRDIRYIPFAEYAEDFKLIEDSTESIFVAVDETSREILRLQENGIPCSPRTMQKYLCSVSKTELENLKSQNAVKDYGQGIYCLANPDYYDENKGIVFTGKDYYIDYR